MIYFYYGEDSFRAQETVDALRKKFISVYDPSGNNIEHFDADDFTLEKFFTAAKALGFLASRKFIIVKNLFSHKEFSDVQQSLIEFLKSQKNNKDENYIVFWEEGNPRENTKLFKYLKGLCAPKKCLKNFKALSYEKLVDWVQAHALHYHKKIDPSAIELLIVLVGTDMWLLHNEIHKLCHVHGAPVISVKDVEWVCSQTASDSVFSFLDALGEKNKTRALSLLEGALKSNDALYLVAMIIRQYRLILLVKECGKMTRNSYAIARKLALPLFVTKKLLRQSANYALPELARIYKNLIAIDAILKSGPDAIKAALTLFINKL